MVFRRIAYVLYVTSAGILIYWLATGAHVFSATSRLVTETDPLLGTTTQHWVSEYHPGLDLLGPVMLALLMLATIGIYYTSSKRRRKS